MIFDVEAVAATPDRLNFRLPEMPPTPEEMAVVAPQVGDFLCVAGADCPIPGT